LIGGVPVAEGKKKHAGGRPPKFIDYAEIERMAEQGATQEEMSEAQGIANSNLRARSEFQAAYKKGQEKLRRSLRRRAVEIALDEDAKDAKTMLIFLLKNFCGMRDVWDIKQEVSGNLNVDAALRKIANTDLKDIPDVTTPKG